MGPFSLYAKGRPTATEPNSFHSYFEVSPCYRASLPLIFLSPRLASTAAPKVYRKDQQSNFGRLDRCGRPKQRRREEDFRFCGKKVQEEKSADLKQRNRKSLLSPFCSNTFRVNVNLGNVL